MLAELLRSQRAHFDGLAHAWLEAGASAVSVWANGRLLACWPESEAQPGPGIAAPLRQGGQVFGELRVSGLDGPANLARLRVETNLLASLAPLSRDLYRVTSELINTRDQILAMYHLSQINRSCLEVEQNLYNLAVQLPRLVKAESAFVLLEVEGLMDQIVHYPEPLIDNAYLWELSRQIENEDHRLIMPSGPQGGWSPEARSLLVLPFQVRGAKRAALGLVNKMDGPFLSPDIKLARAIALHAGAQLENVLMFQENMRLARLQTEMELAQRVQVSLLPKEPPVIEGIDLCASSYPASLVGGDFYDFIVRPGHPLTLVVGDLSGKGFPAALLMSMTRTVLRSEMGVFSTPEAILRGMNTELYDDFTRLDSFATLFIGQYYPTRREIQFANAGHSPVIFCPAGQPPRLLEADGTAMGILPHSLSHDQSLLLSPGDVLIIGTDGLAEASNRQGRRFSYERLLALSGSLVHLPADEISQGIYNAVSDFSAGVPQEDDQTLVVLKCIHV